MNALAMYLLFRFWRQLVFALIVCWACQIWLGGSTWVIAGSFAGGFAFVEALFLVDRRRRLRRGLPPRSRPVVVASAIFLCVVPGVAFGLGFASGRHFPGDSSSATAAPKKPKPPHTHRTIEDETGGARDGEIAFVLLDVEHSAGVRNITGALMTSVPGDRLTVVDVLVATGVHFQAPFCKRGYGALLIDRAGRRFETVAGENSVRAASDVATGIRVCDPFGPGEVAERLVFQTPASDVVAGIAFWDKGEESDRLGHTYIYFRAAKHGAVPNLGATAWGPPREH